MKKNVTRGIVIGGGILLVHGEGREVLHLWFDHAERDVAMISKVTKPEARVPEHAADREAEGQYVRMSRATQVATPSASVVYGSPESPAR